MRRKPLVPIVADRNFIIATRDTGYKSTAAAVAELVDNSLQAGARHVDIRVIEGRSPTGREITISVLDDGRGMDEETLQIALQFGGSRRFNDRTGQGRYGMGLPNSSVSQARRVDVFTWQPSGPPLHSYLDVDEIARGDLTHIPLPKRRHLPAGHGAPTTPSGTLVCWSHCDRLASRKAVTICQKLFAPLGRMFRYYLWDGVAIRVNGEPIQAIDPLYLHQDSAVAGGMIYGAPMTYELRVPGRFESTSTVTVRFAELPVREWSDLPLDERRRLGVVGGAGVSVVRAGREVAYGWHLMGGKRRENYDDWWRCEISFDPVLDELFGVTHSKQDVNPTSELADAIGPDLEAVARELNSRVRAAFTEVKGTPIEVASDAACHADRFLPALPIPADYVPTRREQNGINYEITHARSREAAFYRFGTDGNRFVLSINSNHPFFDHIYRPACEGDGAERFRLECLLLALARADAELDGEARELLRRHRRSWSNALALFLDG